MKDKVIQPLTTGSVFWKTAQCMGINVHPCKFVLLGQTLFRIIMFLIIKSNKQYGPYKFLRFLRSTNIMLFIVCFIGEKVNHKHLFWNSLVLTVHYFKKITFHRTNWKQCSKSPGSEFNKKVCCGNQQCWTIVRRPRIP